MFSAELEYRLKEIFVENYFQDTFFEFEFMETSKGGEMKLNVVTKKASLGITGLDDSSSKLPNQTSKNKPKSKFIKITNCADHVIFEILDNDKCNVHIFEMKTSIGARKWVDPVKKQFKGAYLQVCSIAACLGITINKTIFYVVYVNDKFNTRQIDKERDPKTLLAEHGSWRPEPNKEWGNSEIYLKFGENKFNKFKLEKIKAEVKSDIKEKYPFPHAEYQIL